MFRAIWFQIFVLWRHEVSQANSANAEKFRFCIWAERSLDPPVPMPQQMTRLTPLVSEEHWDSAVKWPVRKGLSSSHSSSFNLYIMQQQDPSSKLKVIPSKWTFGKQRGWTSVASDLLKEYLGKMKRAGLRSFLPDEIIIILDSPRAHSVLLFVGDHGIPRNTVGVGTGQRFRRFLDSDQQTRFQVIYVLKYVSWITFRKSRISSNCSSQSSLWGAISFFMCIPLQLFVKTIRV